MNPSLLQSFDFDYDPEQFKTLQSYQKFLKKKIQKGKHLPEKITKAVEKVIGQIEEVLDSEHTIALEYEEIRK